MGKDMTPEEQAKILEEPASFGNWVHPRFWRAAHRGAACIRAFAGEPVALVCSLKTKCKVYKQGVVYSGEIDLGDTIDHDHECGGTLRRAFLEPEE